MYEPLTKTLIEIVNSNFKKRIKRVLNGVLDLIKRMITTTSSLPYVCRLLKTHKDNNPLRPIISTAVGSVSKWLVTLLSPLVGTISRCNIENNADFLHRLQAIDVAYDFCFFSFDFVIYMSACA